MKENRAKFVVDLAGNVAERARRFGASIRKLGADGSRSMRLLKGATGAVNGALDRFDNKLAGIVTGGGFVMFAKRVGDTQQELTELGTTYNMTADQMLAVNEALWQKAAGRKAQFAALTEAANKFLEKTNSPDALLDQIDNIALSIKGVGLSAETSAKFVGTMWNKGIKSGDDMLKLLDGVASLSMTGTGNLSEQLDGLLNLTHGTSWNNPDQLLQLLKMQRLGDAEFGSSGQTSAAMQQLHDALKDKDKRRILERNGVKVWKDKAKGEFVSPNELMLDISTRSKGKERNLSQVFSGDMLKLAMAFSDADTQAQLNAPIQTIDGLVNEKATRNVQTFNGALSSLMTAGERWANINMAKPLQEFADAINALSPEELQQYADTVKNIALGLGGVIAARKAWRGGKEVYDWWKGPKKKGQKEDDPLGAADVVDVYVTNWQENAEKKSGGQDTPDRGRQAADNRFGGVRSKALGQVSMLPSFEEIQTATAEFNEREFDGFTPKYSWAPPNLDKMLQKLFDDAPLTPAQQQPQKPPEGEIKLKVELPEGATVRSSQVQSRGVGITVNTGNTYGDY